MERDFFEAVRKDDLSKAGRMLEANSALARARWLGRAGGDGKMRSLGPPPYNQHTWLANPAAEGSDDPRYTSTPLIYTRNDEMVRLLIEAGADVNARGTSGDLELLVWFYTPLWRAAHDGRLASVKLLVESGADVNFINPDQSNQALKTAVENDRAEVFHYLIGFGAEPDLISAAMMGLVDQVRAILERDKTAVSHIDAHGRSALDGATLLDSFRVCRDGLAEHHDAAAKLLIDRGATVELSHAASLGLLDRAQEIVRHDPGVLSRIVRMKALPTGTAIKESPLQCGRRRGNREMERFLLEHGAVEQVTVVIA